MTQAIENDATASRYRFVRQLGAGGMGAVWQARDELLQRDVAVKSLRNEHDVQPLRNEARALAALRHPHIVAVHDFFLIDEEPFLVMDLVDGPSLGERLAEAHTLSEAEVRRIGIQIAEALGYAHEHGVCHNDVKPANVIFDPELNVHLTDFGVAHLSGMTVSRNDARAVFGTLAYMAPECLTGASPSPAADIYSLGATLFECLAGRPPFVGGASSIAQRLIQPAPLLRSVVPGASSDFENVLARALSPRPSDRFRSAEEFAEALRANPEHKVTRQLLAEPVDLTSKGRAHKRLSTAVAAAALGLVLVGSAATLWWNGDQQPSSAKTTPTPAAGEVFGALPAATVTPSASTATAAASPPAAATARLPQAQPPVVIKSHGKPGKHE